MSSAHRMDTGEDGKIVFVTGGLVGLGFLLMVGFVMVLVCCKNGASTQRRQVYIAMAQLASV